MTPTHTPEPWKVTPALSGHGYDITGPRKGLALPWLVAATVSEDPIDEANAERIVVCVNALKGIPDPEVAIPALVAALEKFMDSMKSDQREKCDVALAMARAALALAVKP